MARTIEEINAAAVALDKPDPHPELPIVITAEEAALFSAQYRGSRRAGGRKVPDHAETVKKLGSGKARLHGHVIEVKN